MYSENDTPQVESKIINVTCFSLQEYVFSGKFKISHTQKIPILYEIISD